jgi:hypothetical protein
MSFHVTEADIGVIALRIMNANPNGIASLAEIKYEIPNLLNLSERDRLRSKTRPNEEIWEQRVRNLISHRGVEGNIFAEGYAVYVEGKPLRITEAGRSYLRSKGH